MSRTGVAWVALAALLAFGSLFGWLLPAFLFDWQPALAWREPWRWWTAAFVHWSPLHLGANLLGALVLALLGWSARLPAAQALAWAAAWPLTQLGLLARPELAHFGGLSGVLHAGVAIAALHLSWRGHRSQRWIGIAIGAGLLVKIGLEVPWGPALRHPQGWDIAIAPWAHASGVAAGFLCAAIALAWTGRPAS